MQVTISITADGDDERATRTVDAVAAALAGRTAPPAGEPSDVRILEEMAAELEQTRSELSGTHDAHTSAVRAHRKALKQAAELERDLKTMKADLAAASADKETWRKLCDSYLKRMEQALDQAETLEESLEHTKEKLTDAEKRAHNTNEARVDTEATVGKLRTSLALAEAEARDLAVKVRNREESNAELEQRIKTLERDLTTARSADTLPPAPTDPTLRQVHSYLGRAISTFEDDPDKSLRALRLAVGALPAAAPGGGK